MKYRNIIALCLGIFAAALLWQYYLWPKYKIKTENPETMLLLDEAAQRELEESLDSAEPGEVLFVGDKMEGNPADSSLIQGFQAEDVIFYSQANKPKDILDLISNEEIKKHNGVPLERKNIIVSPDAANQGKAEEIAAQEITQEDLQNDTSRITMIKLPEEFAVIKDKDSYDKFLQGREGVYPQVNFPQKTFIAVVSAGNMADSFFEIVKVENKSEGIQVFYRVNLIAANDGKELNNYRVIDNTDLNINFIQVK